MIRKQGRKGGKEGSNEQTIGKKETKEGNQNEGRKKNEGMRGGKSNFLPLFSQSKITT